MLAYVKGDHLKTMTDMSLLSSIITQHSNDFDKCNYLKYRYALEYAYIRRFQAKVNTAIILLHVKLHNEDSYELLSSCYNLVIGISSFELMISRVFRLNNEYGN